MTVNADQRAFWTEKAAPKWIAHQEIFDAAFDPVLDLLFQQADLSDGDAVLDIGCGAGHSTLRAAEHVAPHGSVLGADISDALLNRARERAAKRPDHEIAFQLGDAQIDSFEGEHFDHLISRFGVMFFDDSVAAFRNMSKALKPGARVTLACWGEIPENPFFTTPNRIAVARLGQPPKSDRDAPGPFAFRNIDRVCAILTEAGLIDVAGEAHQVTLGQAVNIEDLAQTLTVIGPAANALEFFDGSATDAAAIAKEIAEAFGTKGIPSQINIFRASKPL
ncbi:class I SAM-dependent methyltransferase [Thalassococcus sp. S3]|uniref:class I SAM-dependent methyltransferase n=1 Tax=Thalassococcus sp. S3 TaxID=2017482 RepID=UPI001023F962|nr:class I SAM-dependent methyltransferase [Thalassococcus sp. S3]QBF31786.1 ubiquinone biosynthesis protein UbiE [Thalassococcus sp. S3]